MRSRLLFTPRAQPGESPLSLLRRAAHGNGMRSTLRHAYGFNQALDHSPAALGTLARNSDLFRATAGAMGIPDGDIDAVVYTRTGWHGEDRLLWNGMQVPPGSLSFRVAKTCVVCVQEKGYGLSEWDHCAAVACAEHHVLLESQCPVCRTTWTHDKGPLACDCPLDEISRRLIPVEAPAASLLSRLTAAKDQVGLSLLTVLAKVVVWWSLLGVSLPPLAKALALSDLHQGRWPTGLPDSAEQLHPRIGVAPLLIDARPEARSLARRLLLRQPPRLAVSTIAPQRCVLASEAMAILGVKRVAFTKLRRDGHIRAVSSGFPIIDLNRLLLLTAGQPVDGLAPLKTLRTGTAKISLSKVLTEINAERITAFWCSAESGLEGLQVRRDFVEPQPRSTSLMTLADAAKRLEVHPEYVRRLIKSELLPATRGSATSGVQWLLRPDEVESFDSEYVFASSMARVLGTSTKTFSSRLRSAGLSPVSGPGIDGGIAFLFKRSHVAGVDFMTVVSSPYRSPAGRRRGWRRANSESWTWLETAQHLGISFKQLQKIVANHWLRPITHTTRSRRFDPGSVRTLKRRLACDFCSLETAAKSFEQSVNQFRRCWVDSAEITAHRFGNQRFVAIADLKALRERRNGLVTAAQIAKLTGRARTLCSNLERVGVIRAMAVIGEGSRKVKLYEDHPNAFDLPLRPPA